MKDFLIYNKFVFLILNLVYLLTRFIVGIFYYIFIYPIKLIIELFVFMKQINIYLKIERYLRKQFELEFKNIDCEKNVSSDDIEENLRKILPKDKKIILNHTIKERGFDINIKYKDIKMLISKERGMYVILLEMNGHSLINVHKRYRTNFRKYNGIWF